MKIRVQAQHLQINDIVGSGERVIDVVNRSLRMPSNKVAVTLKKDGHQRTVQWGRYTEIGVERITQKERDDWQDYWANREQENIDACYSNGEQDF